MDRDATLAWLQTVFADLMTVGEIPATDTPDGLGFVLDQTATVYADNPSLSPAYATEIASWYLLTKLQASLLSVATRVQVDGDTFDVSRTLDGIDAWINRLRARIGRLVEPPLPDQFVDSGVGKVVTIYQPYTAGSMREGDESW